MIVLHAGVPVIMYIAYGKYNVLFIGTKIKHISRDVALRSVNIFASAWKKRIVSIFMMLLPFMTVECSAKVIDNSILSNENDIRKNVNIITIETPRLIIRPLRNGDEFQLNRIIKNSIIDLKKWMPWVKDSSMQTTVNYVKEGIRKTKENTGYLPMVIILKKTENIIGGTGFNDRSKPQLGLYEVGYWVDVSHQGKGYATEAVNALALFVFNELYGKRVALGINSKNIRSIAVAKRLGFKKRVNPSTTNLESQEEKHVCEKCNSLPDLDVTFSYR